MNVDVSERRSASAADCRVPVGCRSLCAVGCERNVAERKRVFNNSCPKQTAESEAELQLENQQEEKMIRSFVILCTESDHDSVMF